MKVAVVGSRSYKNYDKIEEILDELTITEIVSGGARGVDSYAEYYAIKNKLPTTIIKPEYEKYGKRAPIIRNIDIINASELVVAFWDGESRGTKFVIDECKRNNKWIKVIKVHEQL